MLGCVALFGAGTWALGQSTILPLPLPLPLTGTGDMASVYLRHLLVQLETPTIFAAGSAKSIQSSSAPLMKWVIPILRHCWLAWPGAGRAAGLRADARCQGRVDVAPTDAAHHGSLSQCGSSLCQEALTAPPYAVGAYASAKLSL